MAYCVFNARLQFSLTVIILHDCNLAKDYFAYKYTLCRRIKRNNFLVQLFQKLFSSETDMFACRYEHVADVGSIRLSIVNNDCRIKLTV